MCSQAASCQQLARGQPSYARAADRPHLPGYQQAQPSHWWVTVLDRSKGITCSYLNTFGLWNSVRPLWAWWWFHSWTLGSTMGWLLSLSCLRACVHRRGASSQFTYANGGGHSEVWRCSSLETPCITHQPPKSAAAWRTLWARDWEVICQHPAEQPQAGHGLWDGYCYNLMRKLCQIISIHQVENGKNGHFNKGRIKLEHRKN